MDSSAMVICSPVDSSLSISRADGRTVISSESLMRLSVVLPMADTTTTSLQPSSTRFLIFSAIFLIFSDEATEEPPYFWAMILKVFLLPPGLRIRGQRVEDPYFERRPVHNVQAVDRFQGVVQLAGADVVRLDDNDRVSVFRGQFLQEHGDGDPVIAERAGNPRHDAGLVDGREPDVIFGHQVVRRGRPAVEPLGIHTEGLALEGAVSGQVREVAQD